MMLVQKEMYWLRWYIYIQGEIERVEEKTNNKLTEELMHGIKEGKCLADGLSCKERRWEQKRSNIKWTGVKE